MIDLSTLGRRFSEAYAVSEDGRVIGMSETADGQRHAFLSTPEHGMLDLNTFLVPAPGTGSSGDWILEVAFEIDPDGTIRGTARHHEQERGFKLVRTDRAND